MKRDILTELFSFNETTDPLDYKSSDSVRAPQITDETAISQLQQFLYEFTKMKADITEFKKFFPENKTSEIAEALDDTTGALDIAAHHMLDIIAKLKESK